MKDMNMMRHFNPKNILTGMLLLGSSLLSPVHAAEVAAEGPQQVDNMATMTSAVEARFGRFETALANEILARQQGDALIISNLNTAVAAMTTRLNTLEASINTVDARFAQVQTLLRADIANTRARLNSLNAALTNNVSYLNSRINQTYGVINSVVGNLQNQNTYNASRVNDLTTQAQTAYNQLTNLENFANAINAEMERIATCVANGSCVNRRVANVQRADFTVHSTEGLGVSTAYRQVCSGWLWWTTCWQEAYTVYTYGTKYTGLYYPTWPFCSITGAQNQDVRDFSISVYGGQWVLNNQPIAGTGGSGRSVGVGGENHDMNQQDGYLFGSCIRFY